MGPAGFAVMGDLARSSIAQSVADAWRKGCVLKG